MNGVIYLYKFLIMGVNNLQISENDDNTAQWLISNMSSENLSHTDINTTTEWLGLSPAPTIEALDFKTFLAILEAEENWIS